MSSQNTISVCLAQPCYGSVSANSARAFWRASSGEAVVGGERVRVDLNCNYSEVSLLALNHNMCWLWALNRQLHGKPVDYFAMLHADVEPEDHWVDRMVEELERHNLDVLGAVVPIKDSNGLTSIALERDDRDPWRPHCRLTMSEVHRLPRTFTAEDVGKPLLLNTGCWVAKFNPEWAREVHFTINDRIAFDEGRQLYVASVEPEDWFFSRRLNELGLRIGATRAVRLSHRGSVAFTNDKAWGLYDHDLKYVSESVIPEGPASNFPAEIDGWLAPEEGSFLQKAAKGKRVLEIGTYCGRSTVCLAQVAQSVVSIDPHDGRSTPRPKSTLDECLGNLRRYGVRDKVDVLRGTVRDFPEEGPFDLAFIDGAHDFRSVQADICYALERLAPGGALAFHDYRKHPGQYDGRWDPGVTKAVDGLVEGGARIAATAGTVALVIPTHEMAGAS